MRTVDNLGLAASDVSRRISFTARGSLVLSWKLLGQRNIAVSETGVHDVVGTSRWRRWGGVSRRTMSSSSSDCRFLYDDEVLVSLEWIDTVCERDPTTRWRGRCSISGSAFDDDGLWCEDVVSIVSISSSATRHAMLFGKGNGVMWCPVGAMKRRCMER